MTNKIIALIFLLIACGSVRSQCNTDGFVLKDKYKGFETFDGTGYVEVEIKDSASYDSYIGAIYATLAENYPHANIKVIGNRVIRIDATSLGISVSQVTGGILNMYVDFTMTIEIREKTTYTGQVKDSTGVLRTKTTILDSPCVRFSAPSIKKLTYYNPYYKSEVKEYLTRPLEMHEALMEKGLGGYRPMSCDLISEITEYIVWNIRAEMRQNYYMNYKNGEFYESLGKKHTRSER
ncbi:MAG: hypothetical protein IJU90_00290 [Bacteroidales bacterium]|nr:hypothetical protein [Bacteroidales bacterium]